MNYLLVMFAWNKINLYSILDNIPCNSKILIFNLKWMNSNIDSRIIINENITVVDIEYKEDFLEILNSYLLKSKLEYTKLVLLKPNKIPVYNLIVEYTNKLEKKQIYINDSFYTLWYDKNIINNISFKNEDVFLVFSDFIESLINVLKYNLINSSVDNSISSNLNNLITSTDEVKKKEKKYDTIIYSRCKTLLFEQIKNCNICSKLYSINFGRSNLNEKLENILLTKDDSEYVIFINHYSTSINANLEHLKNIKVSKATVIKDENDNKIYVFNKKDFIKMNVTNYYTDLEILSKFDNYCENITIKSTDEKKSFYSKSDIEKSKSSNNDKHFIFILPFMYNGDRYGLFETCIKNLRYQLDKSSISNEILIFECGEKKILGDDFIEKYIDQYIFQEYLEVFNRAWCFNVASRYCNIPQNKKTYFIFMDSDILIDYKWIDDLKNIDDNILIGWNKLYDVDEKSTKKIVSDNSPICFSDLTYKNERYPDIYNACGGISIVEKNTFFKVKGFPEYFKGTWGGEDNAFMRKLIAYNFTPKIYANTIYHMYHSHKTIKDDSIRKKWSFDIKNWDNVKWIVETENIRENWGLGKKVSIAMINYLREEKLIHTLTSIYNNTRMPLDIIIQIQGRNDLSEENKNKILKILSKFKSYNIIWNDDNLGTAIPRYNTTIESLKNKSDYTIIVDSDMIINNGTLELLFNKIEQEKEYGAISCWCNPYYYQWKIEDNKLNKYDLSEGFVETDTLGTGCVIIRTDIFNKAKFNNKLVIGYIDFMWCMEVKRNTDYKLGILCDINHKIINDSSKNDKKYTNARNNKKEFERSKQYVLKKYKIEV